MMTTLEQYFENLPQSREEELKQRFREAKAKEDAQYEAQLKQIAEKRNKLQEQLEEAKKQLAQLE